MKSYVYITVDIFSEEDKRAFSGLGIGHVKLFERSGSTVFSLRVDASTRHLHDAIATLRKTVESVSNLSAMLRVREPQLGIVMEGSQRDGFPSLTFDLETLSFLSALNASIDVDIYCTDNEREA